MINHHDVKTGQLSNGVLVITNDSELAAILEHTLSPASIAYIVADTMLDAAKIVERGTNPAVILIDLSADQALEFVEQVKGHARFSQIPVLAVTEDPSLPEVKLALKAGANRWITKSFVGHTLLAVMRQFAII